MRQPGGRKRVHMLLAYGVKQDGTRHLLAFLRSSGESQQAWERLLQNVHQRGLSPPSGARSAATGFVI